MYGLLTKLVRSRWLDIGLVLFLRVYGPRRWLDIGQVLFLRVEQAWSIKDLFYGIKHQNMINYTCGTKPVSRAGKIAPSCPPG